jgi:CheY-like chemotaxis protein
MGSRWCGIVHDHGGHLIVDTRPGEGTFRSSSALHGAGADPEHETLTGFEPARAKRLRGRAARGRRRGGRLHARAAEGWGLEVAVAENGAAARDAFARAPEDYHLVITDQTMPRLTGMELARQLLALRPALPVILYSGYADAITDAQVQAAGIRALVRKPVEPAALRALLASLLPAAA